ncbi:unnamed protein product [Ilex paraguariensis]|uniref:Secreted protein n=1 Tax=Ilex paraguariensis TaxID=185542 RepID=A0ABC8SRH7_9AQUA
MNWRMFTVLMPGESLPVLPSVTLVGATSSVHVPPEPPPRIMIEPRDPGVEIESSKLSPSLMKMTRETLSR